MRPAFWAKVCKKGEITTKRVIKLQHWSAGSADRRWAQLYSTAPPVSPVLLHCTAGEPSSTPLHRRWAQFYSTAPPVSPVLLHCSDFASHDHSQTATWRHHILLPQQQCRNRGFDFLLIVNFQFPTVSPRYLSPTVKKNMVLNVHRNRYLRAVSFIRFLSPMS